MCAETYDCIIPVREPEVNSKIAPLLM